MSCLQATEERPGVRRWRPCGSGSVGRSWRRLPAESRLRPPLARSPGTLLSLCECAARGFCSAAAAHRVLAAGSVKHVVSSNCLQWSGAEWEYRFPWQTLHRKFCFSCQNKQSLHSIQFIVKLLSIVKIALIIRCFLRHVAVF